MTERREKIKDRKQWRRMNEEAKRHITDGRRVTVKWFTVHAAFRVERATTVPREIYSVLIITKDDKKLI